MGQALGGKTQDVDLSFGSAGFRFYLRIFFPWEHNLPYFSFDYNMVSFFILQLRTSRTDIQDRQIKKEVCSLSATIDTENSVDQRKHNWKHRTCSQKKKTRQNITHLKVQNRSNYGVTFLVYLHQVRNFDDLHGTSRGGGGEVPSLLRHQGSSGKGGATARRWRTGRQDKKSWKGDQVRLTGFRFPWRGHGFKPRWSPEFCSGFFTQLHKLRSLRGSFLHSHFISAVHMWFISYIINTFLEVKLVVIIIIIIILIIIIIKNKFPLFILASIYSTNASGAE